MGEPGYAVAGAPEDACVGVAAQVPPLDSAHDAHRVDDLLPAGPQWLKDLKYRSRLQDVARIWENGLHWSVRPILPVFPYPGDILQSRTVHVSFVRSFVSPSFSLLFPHFNICSQPYQTVCCLSSRTATRTRRRVPSGRA